MRKNYMGVIALLFIGAVFGAVLVSSLDFVEPTFAQVEIGSKTPPDIAENKSLTNFNNSFIETAEKLTPSTVKITVLSKSKSNPHEGFEFFFPKNDMPRQHQGGGSGVIISADGYILTNNHVVEDATEVTVNLMDKRKFDAKVIGTDPLTDLAVIKIDAKDLPAAYLGDSDKLQVGQWVMAIGNPMALTSTVTAGIISALGRSVNIIKDSYGVEDFIQTDAAINPGNSGGALVDLNGAVIGINSAIATNGMTGTYIGYGFAIPINIAKVVAEDLISSGKVKRGYIGVRIEEVEADLAKAVGLGAPRGILIQQVMDDGAAAKEDIQPGDIIIDVDGKEVNKPNDLQSYVASKSAGDKVELNIFRDGDYIFRKIKLKAPDAEEVEVVEEVKNKKKKEGSVEEITFDTIGLTVRDMRNTELDEYKLEAGVLISKVKRFSKADNQRLFAGLVITEVDRKKIETVSDLEDNLEDKIGDAVLLKVVDGSGTSRYVGIEIPE
ncbi:MAG: Do family serine endopeptidase [Patescibacteria group bacterium]|jgi:serine protease Do|nr:Do family serine endopeptidase [Patescibacteria group bacterium]